MNLRQVLISAREILREKNIENASLEAEVLLRHVLGLNRANLFSRLEQKIDYREASVLRQLLERRLHGEPTAYITGHREFYGLGFIVDRNVLIPRPETELLVEKVIAIAAKREIKTIADIGTGSGAVAVSLAVNLPKVTVYAVDISFPALEIAARNCEKHGVKDRVVFLQGNLLEPLPERVDVIIANLPYLTIADLQAQKELSYEPVLALRGGEDGLELVREFIEHAGEKLSARGCLLLELGLGQVEKVTELLKSLFPLCVIEIHRDLAGIERVVSLRLT